jgi:hypothetical protein
VITPPACTGLHPRRDLLHGDAGRQEQAGQRVNRADRPLAGGVGMQRKEELPIGKAPGQPVRGVHSQSCLADSGHPVNHADPRRPAARGHAGQRSQEPRQLALAAGEAADITRQAPRSRYRRPIGRSGQPGCQHLRGRRPPARRRNEQHPHLPGQAERISQQYGGVLAGGAVDTSLQVTDRPRAQTRSLGQLLLREPGLGPELPQQPGETQKRLRHASILPHKAAVAMQRVSRA